MTAYGSECFTMNEVNCLKILQDVIDGRLTTSLASQRLGLTDRHCRRLLARYRESGPLALANRRRGLRGNRQLVPGLAELALGIIRDNYADFGPTLACVKLAELHDVVLAKETVLQLMVRGGLWIPRKMRAPRIQQPRYRRACVGELITRKTFTVPSANARRNSTISLPGRNCATYLNHLLFSMIRCCTCLSQQKKIRESPVKKSWFMTIRTAH